MATTLYFTNGAAANLSSDQDNLMSPTPGASFQSATGSTVAGPTSGVSIALNTWWYQVNAVTISGTITKNFWMAENNMSANVGAQVVIDRCDSAGTFISTVHNSEKGTELIVATPTAENWATGTVTSTAFASGDYIRIRVMGNDVGTMAAGFTFQFDYNTNVAGVDGDSFVTFTETITAFSGGGSTDSPMPYIGGGYYPFRRLEEAVKRRFLRPGWERRPSGLMVPA